MKRLQSLIQLCKYILRDLPSIQKLEETKRGETTFLSLQQISLKPLPYFKENPEKTLCKNKNSCKTCPREFSSAASEKFLPPALFCPGLVTTMHLRQPTQQIANEAVKILFTFQQFFKLDQVTVQISSLYFCLHGLRRGRKGKFSLLKRFPYQ